MKKKAKAIAFLLLIAIASSISIGPNYKYILQVRMNEVEAEASWETMKTWYHYGDTSSDYNFIYDTNYYYRFRHRATNLSGTFIRLYITGSYVTGWGIGMWKEINEDYAIDDVWYIYDNDSNSNFYYFAQEKSLSTKNGKYGKTLTEVLNNGVSYRIHDVNMGGYGEQTGYIYFERQLKNQPPSVSLAEPSSNSPLQTLYSNVKEVVLI